MWRGEEETWEREVGGRKSGMRSRLGRGHDGHTKVIDTSCLEATKHGARLKETIRAAGRPLKRPSS